MAKTLYLIRHGQSQANAEGRVQGWLDSPLSPLGMAQARQVAQRLAAEGVEFFAVYSSPLERAAETARAITDTLGCPLYFNDGLREINTGPLSGLTGEEIAARYPERHRAYLQNQPLPPIPGVETEAEFLRRVAAALDTILAHLPDGQTAGVVTHGGTLNACMRHWLRLNNHGRRSFRFGNASISVVRVLASHVEINRLNDTCHLHILEEVSAHA